MRLWRKAFDTGYINFDTLEPVWPESWCFIVTRCFIEDFGFDAIPKEYEGVYYNYDTAAYTYARKEIAWAMRIFYQTRWLWWHHRWIIERELLHRGILYSPTYYVRDIHFNWDWRWYDESTWRVSLDKRSATR